MALWVTRAVRRHFRAFGAKRTRFARQAHVSIGARVHIGDGVHCLAHLHLGDDVYISDAVAFVGDDHPFDFATGTIQDYPARPLANIRLEGENFIGYGAIILGSVRIGRGAVIAPGSLVTGDVPAGATYAGFPARVVSSTESGSFRAAWTASTRP